MRRLNPMLDQTSLLIYANTSPKPNLKNQLPRTTTNSMPKLRNIGKIEPTYWLVEETLTAGMLANNP